MGWSGEYTFDDLNGLETLEDLLENDLISESLYNELTTAGVSGINEFENVTNMDFRDFPGLEFESFSMLRDICA